MLGFGDKTKERMLKMAIDLIGPEQISEMIQGLLAKAIEHKQTVELQQGETDCIGLLYEKDSTIYFAMVGFNNTTDQVTRYIEHYSVTDLANKLISK